MTTDELALAFYTPFSLLHGPSKPELLRFTATRTTKQRYISTRYGAKFVQGLPSIYDHRYSPIYIKQNRYQTILWGGAANPFASVSDILKEGGR
jgi:hypothetical protein